MTSFEQLIEHLKRRQGFKDSCWIEQLDPRKREEIEFHNFDRETHDETVRQSQKKQNVHANRKYYSITDSSVTWVDRWIETYSVGRVFLDFACGNGQRAIQAARAGARLSIGIDISDVSIRNARDIARAAGVDANCLFVQGDCEMTELPGGSIDTILCCGMLHHLDLDRAYRELHRILKPGGRVLGVEALGHNPAIQLYRDLTPHLRTTWEARHILKMRDIRRAELFFKRGQTRFWHLAVLAAVPFRQTPFFSSVLSLGQAFDTRLLALPGFRLMAWQVTFELIKPESDSKNQAAIDLPPPAISEKSSHHLLLFASLREPPLLESIAAGNLAGYIPLVKLLTTRGPKRFKIHALLWRLYCIAHGFFTFPKIFVIREHKEIIHYSFLLPQLNRLKEAGAHDLEIGPCWTRPSHRRNGYFRYALVRIRRDFWHRNRRFWIVCRVENEISLKAILKCGFTKIGMCRRLKYNWKPAHYYKIANSARVAVVDAFAEPRDSLDCERRR